MRQKIVRLVLVGGVLVLAMLLLLATCGSGEKDTDEPEKQAKKKSPAEVTQLTVPSAYAPERGWELIGTSPDYAISRTTGRLAYLVRESETKYQLRTIDSKTGETGWHGESWRPPSPHQFPKLLAVTVDDHEYFVTWAYGKVGENALTPADTIVSLDVYDVEDGSRRRVEVPWNSVPTVSTTGPGILISDGRTNSAVVDPVTGRVSKVAAPALKYPKDCKTCKQLTEVRGLTQKGLLVSGSKEFWVQGGWFSRNVAPKGTDKYSGIPTSVVPGLILAKWQLDKKAKRAATHDMWVVHDVETGKPLASVECSKPAIKPGQYPQLVAAPSGSYLVAGPLAFDLATKRGFCFEGADGTKPLTLASVNDEGTAYGAASARNAADVLAGGGAPVAVAVRSGSTGALPSNVRVPGMETADGVGLFRWTDEKDRPHLIGYPRSS
ncbi:hypothetical protein OOK13_39610 [Streptomyces sp. NBC_00378]|uniref:hypothetical protein n=1 Tax=unclassified Streptomyces TaxID=2593676 RepID=UPI00224CAE53|nr:MULTISPECIES: hypothetical protein [unclassified Streptomyces]MCX5114468.1 hypothetical protein [Streptomyces sp. NBC_00378]